MAVYINGTGAITIQDTLGGKWNAMQAIDYHEPYVRCIEPPFQEYIHPMAARRMSRIIKRAIVASDSALKQAGVENPDIILSGTGLGCIDDTEKFLNAMVRTGERFLQPTHFIQSTHNTISSQIAMHLHCHGYNNTHVHRGVSFESVLLEGALLLGNGRGDTALVGGHDEMTPGYFQLLKRIGYCREQVDSTLDIIHTPARGSFAGEGSVAFVLSTQKSAGTFCKMAACAIFYKPADLKKTVTEFLAAHALPLAEIDLILTGENGDTENDRHYQGLYPVERVAHYKHYCGEYFTSAAFGTMVGAEMVKSGLHGHILLHNHSQNKNHSFILLRPC